MVDFLEFVSFVEFEFQFLCWKIRGGIRILVY